MKNLTLTLLLIAGTSSLAAAEPDFESIFDGKSLAGWAGDPKLWSVQGGAITGVTTDENPLPHNNFLIWDGEVENFELRVKARVFGANNSGIQYRSKLLQEVGEFVVAGYQCDIHPQYTGLLIHEKGRLILAMNGQEVIIDNDDKKWLTGLNPAPAIKLDEWNTFEVIAIGNKLVHKVNGEVYTVAIDHNEKGRDLKGVLAFQIHKGPAMRVQFKDIELKRLPSGGVLSLADAPIPENAKEAPGRQQAGRGQARRNAARPVATASTPAQGGSGFIGKWEAEIQTQSGTQKWTFTFKVDKETLTGGVGMPNGSTAPLYSGKVEGNNITFKQLMPGRQEFELEYSGIHNEGVIEFKRVTPNGTQQFTATRTRGSFDGVWVSEFNSPNGPKKWTFTFKVDKETLTGGVGMPNGSTAPLYSGMTGPVLTAAGGRYSPTDFLDQIINPSKEINEQFVPVVLTKTNGEAITGVIVNLQGDKVTINTDLADPDQRINVDRKEVESIETSPHFTHATWAAKHAHNRRDSGPDRLRAEQRG